MPRVSTAVICEKCGKQVGRKADLKRHMTLHAQNKEELMHGCPFLGCTYKTLQRSNLDTHINMHTGLRPHKCPTRGCGFRTSDPGSLTKHRKVVHGYMPRGRAKSDNASEAAESSPYSSLSSIPSNSGGSISLVEPFLDAYQTPLPEQPQIPGPCPPLVPPTDCCINNYDSKNGSATFLEYPGVNNQHCPVLNTEGLSSFLLAPGLPMSEEVSMSDHAQMFATKQGNLQAINLRVQPFPELMSREVSNTTFNNLLPQSNYSQTPAYTPPFVPTSTTVYDGYVSSLPPPPNAVDNSFVSSAGLCVDDYDYIFGNTSVVSGSQFVGDYYDAATSIPSGCDLPVNNSGYEHYGYGTHAGSFDGQLFAAPEMGTHHEVVDQMHPYTTPTWSNGYSMQGSTYPSDPYLLFYS